MTRIASRRALSTAMAVGLAAGGLMLTPAAAALAAPTIAVTAPDATCTVQTAELKWGVKTSFRNYISGSIANGEWTTENGASYETPAFIWQNGAGTFGADLDEGSVAFTGDIHFTGHGGVMKLDLKDPELVFTGADSAQLVIGVGSTDTGGAELSYERVIMAKVDLTGRSAEAKSLSLEDAPVALTSDGAKALNGGYGDYVAGQEMDPLQLALGVDGCTLAETTGAGSGDDAPANAGDTPLDAASDDKASIPWVPIAVGTGALVVVLVTGGMLLSGGRKKQ